MFNFGRLLFLFIFLSSCNRSSEIEIYRGASSTAKKIIVVFGTKRLPVRIGPLVDLNISLLGESQLAENYSSILLEMHPYLIGGDRKEEIGFKQYFIPQNYEKEQVLDNNSPLDSLLGELEDNQFILKVDNSLDRNGVKVLKIDYVDSPEVKLEVSKLIEKLFEKYKVTSQEISINLIAVTFSSLPSKFHGAALAFSVLEPFSFHVLDSEKTLAGIQLLLLLLLFLLSGFILGIWWREFGKRVG